MSRPTDTICCPHCHTEWAGDESDALFEPYVTCTTRRVPRRRRQGGDAVNPLSDLPLGPPWVRFAARMACLDACDWADRGQVEACIERALTDEQWQRFSIAVLTGIQYASEVVITEGWVEPTRPVWAREGE